MLTRKCQWILMALLVTSLAVPVHTWALGLDELDVTSALNERFVGTIELLDVQGLQPSEIVVSMASREDFERVGVERFFYLTNLKFNVEIEGGKAVVKVSSAAPIAEPYLNFIVEVLWPRGRLLKEFTVLLDPPTFSQAAAPAVQAPTQVAPSPAQRPAQAPATAGTQVDLQPRSSNRPPASRAPVDGLMTTRDDTLWKIASRTLPSNRVSVNQQMLAIQRKNPEAFMRGNINLLKAGYVLDIPSEDEALGISTTAATQEVAAQTQEWRSGDSGEQLASNTPAATPLDDQPQLRSAVDATGGSTQNNASASQGEGQVRIVASTGELASGTASGDDTSINVLIEEKDTLARQVDELNYQLDREKEIATNQITVKDRQLEVKDQELAAMAERLRELEAQAALEPENQNQSPNTPSPDTPWWMSPMVLFGVIALLILLLVVVLIRLRSARAEQEAFENEFYDDNADEQTVVDSQKDLTELNDDAEGHFQEVAAGAAVEPFIDELDDVNEVDELSLDDDQQGADEDDDSDTATATDDSQTEEGKTGDVIGEAEIYIAYGRYGQAANLLSSVLNTEPERWDVRLKLLEVFVESSDEAAFSEQAQYILDHCDDEEVLMACRDLEAQFENSVVDLSQDDDLANAPADREDDVLELDLDELETDKTTQTGVDEFTDLSDEIIEEIETAKVNENPDIEFELEFDDADTGGRESLELDLDDEGAGDELGGDLGINFDPDRTSLEETDATPDSSAEFDLDDLSITEDQPLNDEVTTSEAADDFEFDSPEEGDINATKLDLAEAYIDMGDADGAQDILKEVVEEGSPEQQQKAQSMLDSLNG